jgi:hypothetical protein
MGSFRGAKPLFLSFPLSFEGEGFTLKGIKGVR